jgi:hypothetical protein
MSARLPRITAAGALLLLVGCERRWPRLEWGGPQGPAPVPVGLVAEGPAFRAEGATEAVRHAIEQVIGRPVVLLTAPSRTAEEDLQHLAARSAAERGAIAESRDRPCGAGGAIAAGIAAGVAGVYRVSLDHVVATRERADDEQPAAIASALGAVGLAEPEKTREETLTGSVRWIPFGAARATAVMDVSRTLTHVAPTAFSATLDPAAATTDAVRGLPTPGEADWMAFGSSLAAGGCPLIALWVAETRLVPGLEASRLRGVALAALGGTSRRPAARRIPEGAPPTVTEVESGYSCRDLCGLHMVELCNSDRFLWDANQTRWEATPCGTKRSEPFLQTCYAQQWQSGTFFNACVLPCEGTVEGRQRLIRVLESSGCLTRPS